MSAQHPGIVSIVGAGPGDPGLLTVRARELLTTADVIVYDSAVNTELLPSDARINGIPELYFVGKRGEGRAVPQEDVRQLLITLARQGKRVVRLKGGDPFLFGHGSEDAQALFESQVPFEIVPGITAGIAVPAYAGIPVTHRSLAASVTFVSGREDPGKNDTLVDWKALAVVGGTIVIYNGLKMLPQIASEMMAAGMPGEIPAAAIQSGTRDNQRTVIATLETLAHEASLAVLSGAITIVIGWSIVLRDELSWFDIRPLFGKRIGIVPSPQSTDALRDRLAELGAHVIPLPAPITARLDLTLLRQEMEQLTDYGWILFTTPDAVAIFWEQLLTLGRDTRALAGVHIAAIGARTAAALLDHGITVDVLPERFEAAGLIHIFAARSDVAGANLLYVCDDSDDEFLVGELAQLGAQVTMRPVYRHVYEAASTDRIRRQFERGTLDLVIFSAPASVTQYLRSIGDDLMARAPAAATDETTAETLRVAGLDVVVEGGHAGTPAFADMIVRTLTTR